MSQIDQDIIDNIYHGMPIRVLISIMCFFSLIIVIITNYKTYSIKFQKRDIVSSKKYSLLSIIIKIMRYFKFQILIIFMFIYS